MSSQTVLFFFAYVISSRKQQIVEGGGGMRKRRFFSSPCLSSAREVWGGHGRVRLYCTRGNTVGSHAASPAAAETTTIAHPQSSSQKLLESLKRWEPLSNTVEWFNTNILQYDGVFRHKQNLDQTFLNLKQKVSIFALFFRDLGVDRMKFSIF